MDVIYRPLEVPKIDSPKIDFLTMQGLVPTMQQSLAATPAGHAKLIKSLETVLKDIAVFAQLKGFYSVEREERAYSTMQELLRDLKALEDEALHTRRHQQLAAMLCNLSPNAIEGLRQGLDLQEMEDAWNLVLQETNYSFLP